jgi:hypothetical protein
VNWKYETRRYLYCREEGSFAALSVEARMLAGYILKYTDDKGRIYARTGEDVVEALMFRMRASRGARRWMREAYQELIDDDYLVVVSTTCVRVKNFSVAQAKPEAAPDAAPFGSDQAATALRASDEPAVIDPRPSHEPAATAPRTSNEECVKSADSFECDPALPSVPSGPSLTSSEGLSPSARDPGAGAAGPGGLRTVASLVPFPPRPLPPAPADQAITGQALRDLWAKVFVAVIGGKTEWQVQAGTGMWDRTEAMARGLVAEDIPLLEPTMRTVLTEALESQDEKDRGRHYALGAWCTRFADLRDKALGLRKQPVTPRPPARASPRPVGQARAEDSRHDQIGELKV